MPKPSVCMTPSNFETASNRSSTSRTVNVLPCVGWGRSDPVPKSSVQSGPIGKTARWAVSRNNQAARAWQMAEVSPGSNGLPRMRLVFGFKSAPQNQEKLFSRLARLPFEEQNLGRGTGLLVKLPDIARQANTPILLRGRVVPGACVHRGDGQSGTENHDSRPMRKRQRPNAQNSLFPAPNHRAVHRLRHRVLQIPPAMLEGRHKNAGCQQLTRVALLQLFQQAPRHLGQTFRDAHQGGIAPQQGAGHG